MTETAMRLCKEDIGESIPGSALLRDYCTSCGEPMRVVRVFDRFGDRIPNWCERCAFRPAPRRTRLCERQAVKLHEIAESD